MFRNQYDHDVSVWSPQGRIHQIEYAMEAVKQGSATVGLKSKDYALLVALKRAPNDLASYQQKMAHVDDHVGISIAGLTADGRQLGNYMRNECLSSRWANDQALPISRLVKTIAYKMQIPTQRYGRRPFGVGILVAGCDNDGPHVFYICPSANVYNCKATAIGARSQSARTYLEKHLAELKECENLEELVKHGLRALRDTLPAEVSLTNLNCTIGIVGRDKNFTIYENESIDPYLNLIKDEHREVPAVVEDPPAGPAPPSSADGAPPTSMDTDALD